MRNPWSPSPDEIRQWAYTPHAVEPCQDFDLALAWCGHEKALLECASDEACPGRLYMLQVLYLVVGDAVRPGFRPQRPKEFVEGLVARGDDYPHPDIKRWQRRSRELLVAPQDVDYGRWCAGGFVREDAARSEP